MDWLSSDQPFLLGVPESVAAIGQLEPQSPDDSARLDNSDGSFSWLTVDVKLWSGAQLRLPSGVPTWDFSTWSGVLTKWGLSYERKQPRNHAFQETGTELLGQERKLGETSPVLLLPCSIGQRSNKAFLDSRRWRSRFHFFLLFVFLKLVILYWRIADEQCWDSFRWTAKGFSHIYTCNHSPPSSPSIQAAP